MSPQQKKVLLIGVGAVVVVVVVSRLRSKSSSTGSTGPATAAAAAGPTPGTVSIGDLAAYETQTSAYLAQALADIKAGLGTQGGTTTPTPLSTPTVPSPAPSQAPASNPYPAVSSAFSGYVAPLQAAGVPYSTTVLPPLSAGGQSLQIVYNNSEGQAVTETVNYEPAAA